ncbi:CDP-glucose 4,6-dehydratase [Polaromonas aquatica]|uniref:CDP-glucose 4,6-dehydratase n=1 Tax=Polaromonas aquatica TaxID=332657 RepID=UPI003D6542BF
MTPGFWQGKRVFLTGHTGFKGSWLSLWLQDLGAEVTGYALAPSTIPNLYSEAHVESGMKSVIGDIRDLSKLGATLREAQPEIVIHMAAQSLVRRSYISPVETYATNIMGTVHLLEAVRCTPGVKAVVNVTTDKCYENREWVWAYRENEPMGGYDPYSSSKGCAELVSAAYRSSFFNPLQYNQHGVAIATARAGNVIGGGDWASDRLVPDILTAFESGRPAVIRNPHAVRPWQHVLEPLRGYLTLAEHLYQQGTTFAEAWNFGPHDEDARNVGWIAEQLAIRWGVGASWQTDESIHPHEATYLKLDISKVRSRFGWQPILRLNDALSMIVDWTQQKQAGASLRKLCLAQIQAYCQTCQTITLN